MTRDAKTAFTRMAAPLAVLGCAVLMACTAGATGSGQSSSANAGSPACEILTRNLGGMTVIEGVVTSGKALSGSYSLRVSGSGTNIRQGGEFDAAPNERIVLGKVSLGGSTRAYDIDLKVEAGGRTIPCNIRT